MIKGLENLPQKKSLRGLGLFSLLESKLRADCIIVYKYLKEGYRDDGTELFPEVSIGQDKRQWANIETGGSR